MVINVMNKDEFLVKKASGEFNVFSKSKLYKSLRRSGVDPDTSDFIIEEVGKSLYKGITTKKIYQKAFQILKSRKKAPAAAARYKLKQAIMDMGPSGFPFEKYVAEILKLKGYKVTLDKVLQGHCIKHEVDIIAEKDNTIAIVECKFHNRAGYYCNVHVPLYVHSRFHDLEAFMQKQPQYEDKKFEGWIITNTRFSDDSLKYGICSGLKLIGWDFPEKNGFKEMVDNFRLYPVTALSSLKKAEKDILLQEKIVLCREIYNNPGLLKNVLQNKTNLDNVMAECEILLYEELNNGGYHES